MSISPFNDRPANTVGDKVSAPATANSGIDTDQIDQYRQGISIRSMADSSLSMLPVITPNGFPSRQNERFNFNVDQNTFGIVELWENPGEDGTIAPFDDIVGKFTAVSFLNDPGTQVYPANIVSPVLRDPATMNGIIEPLAIRTKLSNASTDGPIVAHDIRASLFPDSGLGIFSKSSEISGFISFSNSDVIAPFLDSQESLIGNASFRIATPGFDYPEQKNMPPYDDSVAINTTTLAEFVTQRTLGIFNLNERVGVYVKSATAGFVYRNYESVKAKKTGAQKTNGTDSIAFGGLKK
jgi:hypothetical protein